MNTVWRFLRDPSPRKKSSDWGTPKTVIATDLMNINCKLRGKPRKKSKAIFTASGILHVPKTTRNRILGTMSSVRAPLKLLPIMPHTGIFLKYSIGSEVHDVWHSVHWRDQGDPLGLSKWLGNFFQLNVTNVCEVNNSLKELYFRLASLGKDLLTKSGC